LYLFAKRVVCWSHQVSLLDNLSLACGYQHGSALHESVLMKPSGPAQ
jgi:hypothetical protein